jgi:hypothetical protein
MLWLLLVQVGSYALGGYMAGRLRAPFAEADLAEKQFRDGAHGFIVWAIGVAVSAVVLSWTVGGILKTGVDSAASVISSGVSTPSTLSTLSSAADPMEYAIDKMVRGGTASSAAPDTESGLPSATETRRQIRRIMQTGLAANVLESSDRTYLVSTIASMTGLAQADAEKRVDDAFEALRKAKESALQAADQARRSGAIAGFLEAAALLIAAAAAASGAGLGGRHRDERGTLRIFGRERFW